MEFAWGFRLVMAFIALYVYVAGFSHLTVGVVLEDLCLMEAARIYPSGFEGGVPSSFPHPRPPSETRLGCTEPSPLLLLRCQNNINRPFKGKWKFQKEGEFYPFPLVRF